LNPVTKKYLDQMNKI